MMLSRLLAACSFFDMDENSSGKLAGALAQDAAVLRGAVGDTFGVVTQNLSVMAGGCWSEVPMETPAYANAGVSTAQLQHVLLTIILIGASVCN